MKTLSASSIFVVLFAFFGGVQGLVARTAATPALRTASGENPLRAVPLSGLSATRERPIFSPLRRPPAPPVFATPAAVTRPEPVPPPLKPQHPTLKLVGTVIGETRQIGVFLEETTQKIVHL